MWAKQSTAATLIVGPVLDSTGAEHTGLIIGDLSLSKNGGTLTALAAAATLTHIANGQYTLVMTTTNLDTLGRLQLTCNKSTYQMPPIGLLVVPAMVFDSLVLGTDVLQSDVTQFGGTAGTFAAGIPTAVLDSAATAALVDLIWDEATSGISSLLAASVLTPGTITEFPDTLTIGDSYTTANGRSIQIPIVDTDGNQISSTGSLNFADATATFVIKRAKETDSTRIITGTAAFTDPVGTGTSGAPYAVVQLTSSETAKGLIGYKYSGVLTFTWPYVGTGTDPEVMSFETDTLNFDN